MNRGILARHLVHSRLRLLLDEKSASNENFRDQLAAADIIVANKSDRAMPKVSKRYSVGGSKMVAIDN